MAQDKSYEDKLIEWLLHREGATLPALTTDGLGEFAVWLDARQQLESKGYICGHPTVHWSNITVEVCDECGETF